MLCDTLTACATRFKGSPQPRLEQGPEGPLSRTQAGSGWNSDLAEECVKDKHWLFLPQTGDSPLLATMWLWACGWGGGRWDGVGGSGDPEW